MGWLGSFGKWCMEYDLYLMRKEINRLDKRLDKLKEGFEKKSLLDQMEEAGT